MTILERMEKDDGFLIGCLEALYAFQTEDEKVIGTTVLKNGRGFSGSDATILSSFVEHYRRKKSLSPKQLDFLRRSLKKYTGQLEGLNIESMPIQPLRELVPVPVAQSAPIATMESKRIVLTFPYDPNLVRVCNTIPGHHYDGTRKAWSFTPTLEAVDVIREKGITIGPSLQLWYEEIMKSVGPVKIDENIHIPGLKKTLYPFQRMGVAYIEAKDGRVLLADDMGLGKEIPVETPVLTKKGWVPVGTIKVGDRVYSSDGKLHNVIGVYPQGVKQILRMTFSEGTTTECGWDHQWKVIDNNAFRKGEVWKVLNTRKLSKDLCSKNGVGKWRIPITKPIQYNEIGVIVPPYILGVLIGDGSLLNNGIRFCPGDNEVPEKVGLFVSSLYKVRRNADYGTSTTFSITYEGEGRKNPLSTAISEMGLKVKGEFKFIPKQYKTASVHQRKLLLAGLMDTDGCTTGARTRFTTTSRRLADDVIDLVRGLGGLANKSVVPGRFRIRNGRSCQELDCWQLTIRTAFNPFLVDSKRAKWRQSYRMARIIKSIVPTRKAESVCISVDSPDSTYIIKDYVVTHNTCQALAYLQLHPELRPALIVCPASLKLNWEKEAKMWTTEERIHVLSGRPKISLKQMKRELTGFIIINYDILANVKEKDESGNKHNVPETGWVDYLKQINIKCIVGDEIHYCKDSKTDRTKAFNDLAKKYEKLIFLSGTPIKNRPIEIYNGVHLIAPYAFPSRFKFAMRYCNAKGNGFGWDFTGHSNVEELHEKLTSTCMLRRLKKDVLPELPQKTRSLVPLEIENMDEYREAEFNFSEWIREFNPDRAEGATRVEAIAKIEYLKQICIRGKIKQCMEWIDTFLNSGEKLVVFATHRSTIDQLMERFGKEAVKLYGGMSDKAKEESKERFQKDDDVRLFCGNILAAGVGATLTAASNMAFLELPWTPGDLVQAEDRILRIGQMADSLNIHFLTASNTIDEMMAEMLESKAKVLGSVLDGVAMEETSLVFDLIKKVKGEKVK